MMLNATPNAPPLLTVVSRTKPNGKGKTSRGVGKVIDYALPNELKVVGCGCGCGETFQTANKRRKYLNKAHSMRAYRARLKTAHSGKCAYCGETFTGRRKGAKYCSNSHAVMAHRRRKGELIATLVSRGMPYGDVMDCLDIHGIKATRIAAGLI